MENSDLVTLAVIKLGDPVYNGGKGQKRRGRMCFFVPGVRIKNSGKGIRDVHGWI